MDSLANNDGHGFFVVLGASVVTGPTMTNVNDFRALLITGSEASRTLVVLRDGVGHPRSAGVPSGGELPTRVALD
jgi:hypothetical protein